MIRQHGSPLSGVGGHRRALAILSWTRRQKRRVAHHCNFTPTLGQDRGGLFSAISLSQNDRFSLDSPVWGTGNQPPPPAGTNKSGIPTTSSYIRPHPAVPDLDNPDTSLSRMNYSNFRISLHRSLIRRPGSLAVPDRFFGFWPSGVAGCECITVHTPARAPPNKKTRYRSRVRDWKEDEHGECRVCMRIASGGFTLEEEKAEWEKTERVNMKLHLSFHGGVSLASWIRFTAWWAGGDRGGGWANG